MKAQTALAIFALVTGIVVLGAYSYGAEQCGTMLCRATETCNPDTLECEPLNNECDPPCGSGETCISGTCVNGTGGTPSTTDTVTGTGAPTACTSSVGCPTTAPRCLWGYCTKTNSQIEYTFDTGGVCVANAYMSGGRWATAPVCTTELFSLPIPTGYKPECLHTVTVTQLSADDSGEVCYGDCGGTGGGGDGGNSFVAGTPVMLSDETSKPIEQIKTGDKVRSFSPETGEFSTGAVTWILTRNVNEVYHIEFDDESSVEATGTHPFYVKTAAPGVPTKHKYFVTVENLRTGDTVYKADKGQNIPVRIASIGKIEKKTSVYNFNVEPLHTYIANSMMVHNLKEPGNNLPPAFATSSPTFPVTGFATVTTSAPRDITSQITDKSNLQFRLRVTDTAAATRPGETTRSISAQFKMQVLNPSPTEKCVPDGTTGKPKIVPLCAGTLTECTQTPTENASITAPRCISPSSLNGWVNGNSSNQCVDGNYRALVTQQVYRSYGCAKQVRDPNLPLFSSPNSYGSYNTSGFTINGTRNNWTTRTLCSAGCSNGVCRTVTTPGPGGCTTRPGSRTPSLTSITAAPRRVAPTGTITMTSVASDPDTVNGRRERIRLVCGTAEGTVINGTTGGCTGTGGTGGGTGGTGGGNVPNIFSTVQSVRAEYGAQPSDEELGEMLNTMAWINRAGGWGLSTKSGGTRCPSPQGVDIACDILYHRPTNVIVDVLVGAGEQSDPAWQVLGVNTQADRPWLAPMQPSGGGGSSLTVSPSSVTVVSGGQSGDITISGGSGSYRARNTPGDDVVSITSTSNPSVFRASASGSAAAGTQHTRTIEDTADTSKTAAITITISSDGSGSRCGNGQIDEGEECDGSNRNGETCASLGYDRGILRCNSDCNFDTSTCRFGRTTAQLTARPTFDITGLVVGACDTCAEKGQSDNYQSDVRNAANEYMASHPEIAGLSSYEALDAVAQLRDGTIAILISQGFNAKTIPGPDGVPYPQVVSVWKSGDTDTTDYRVTAGGGPIVQAIAAGYCGGHSTFDGVDIIPNSCNSGLADDTGGSNNFTANLCSGELADSNPTCTFTVPAEWRGGGHFRNLYCRVQDESGLYSGAGRTSVIVDSIPPTSQITSPTANSVQIGSFPVTVTDADDGELASCYYSVSNTASTTTTATSGNIRVSQTTSVWRPTDIAYSNRSNVLLAVWNSNTDPTGVLDEKSAVGQFMRSDGTLAGSNIGLGSDGIFNGGIKVAYNEDDDTFLVVWGTALDNDVGPAKGSVIRPDGTFIRRDFDIAANCNIGGHASSLGNIAYSTAAREFIVSCTRGIVTGGTIVLVGIRPDGAIRGEVTVTTGGAASTVAAGPSNILVAWVGSDGFANARLVNYDGSFASQPGRIGTIVGGAAAFYNAASGNYDVFYGSWELKKKTVSATGVVGAETTIRTAAEGVGFSDVTQTSSGSYWVVGESQQDGDSLGYIISPSGTVGAPASFAEDRVSPNYAPSITVMNDVPVVVMNRGQGRVPGELRWYPGVMFAQIGSLGGGGNGRVRQCNSQFTVTVGSSSSDAYASCPCDTGAAQPGGCLSVAGACTTSARCGSSYIGVRPIPSACTAVSTTSTNDCSDGTCTVRAWATDRSRNVGSPDSRNFIIRTLSTNITSPEAGSYQTDNFSVSVQDRDYSSSTTNLTCTYDVYTISAIALRTVTNANRTCNSNFTVSVGPDGSCRNIGQNTCRVVSRVSRAGISSTDERFFSIDWASPVSTITAAPTGWVSGNFTVSVMDDPQNTQLTECQYRVVSNGTETVPWRNRTCSTGTPMQLAISVGNTSASNCRHEGGESCLVMVRPLGRSRAPGIGDNASISVMLGNIDTNGFHMPLGIVTTNRGINFSGTTRTELRAATFYVCNSRSSVSSCISAYNSGNRGQNSPNFCGSIAGRCELRCSDRDVRFYFAARGIPIGTSEQVIVLSQIGNASCPVFNIAEINRLLDIFHQLDREISIQIMEIDEFIRQNGETDTANNETLDVLNEALLITRDHLNYMNATMQELTVERAQELIATSNSRLDEINRLLRGLVSPLRVRLTVNMPSTIRFNRTTVLPALITKSGNRTAYARVACAITMPNTSVTRSTSSCLTLDGNTTFDTPFMPSLLGQYTYSCTLARSVRSDCSFLVNQTPVTGTFRALPGFGTYITTISGPTTVLRGREAVVTATVANPDDVEKFGTVRCDFTDPFGSLRRNTSACTQFGNDLNTDVQVTMIADRVGNWSVSRCQVSASEFSGCTGAVLDNVSRQVVNYTVATPDDVFIESILLPTAPVVNGSVAFITMSVTNPTSSVAYVNATCTLVPSYGPLRIGTTAGMESGTTRLFSMNVTTDAAGIWSVSSCTTYKSSSPSLVEQTQTNMVENPGRFTVIARTNLSISSVTVPPRVNNRTSATVTIIADNPSVARYGRASCVFRSPANVQTTNLSACMLVEDSASIPVSIYLNKEGIWNVESCSLFGSVNPDCTSSALHDRVLQAGAINSTTTDIVDNPVCGDGQVGGTEQCDNGQNNGPCNATCSTSCTINNCGGCTPGLYHAFNATNGACAEFSSDCVPAGWINRTAGPCPSNANNVYINSVSVPSSGVVNNTNVDIIATVTNPLDDDRFAYISCFVRNPSGNSVLLTSSCTGIQAGSSRNYAMSVFVDETGTWNVTSCSANASVSCSSAVRTHTFNASRTFTVARGLNLSFVSVIPPSNVLINNTAVVSASVRNPSEAARFAQVTCNFRKPNNQAVQNSTGCVQVGGTSAQNFDVNIFANAAGTWTVTSCTVRGGLSDCSALQDSEANIGAFNVTALSIPVISSFSASPPSINEGGSINLSWSTSGADSASIDNDIGVVPVSGSLIVTPFTNTTYMLTATNAQGSASRNASVTVNVTIGNLSVVNIASVSVPAGDVINNSNVNIHALVRNPLDDDRFAYISCFVRNPAGAVQLVTSPCEGIQASSLNTYTASVFTGITGRWNVTTCSINASASCASATRQHSINASKTFNVIRGINLSFASFSTPSNTPLNTIAVLTSGVRNPSDAARFARVTCSFRKPNNQIVSNSTGCVQVEGGGSVTPFDVNIFANAAGTWSITGCTLRGSLSADCSALQDSEANIGAFNVTPAPTVPVISAFSAFPSLVNPGGNVNLSWSTTGATSATIHASTADFIPSVPVSGSIIVTPMSNTTYTLTAINSEGSSNRSVNVTVNITISGLTNISILSVSVPSGDVINNSNININVLAANPLDDDRFALVSCSFRNPFGSSTLLSSSCSGIQANSTRTYNVPAFIDVVGRWNVTTCSINASTSCSTATQTHSINASRTFNVVRGINMSFVSFVLPANSPVNSSVQLTANVRNPSDAARYARVTCSFRTPSNQVVSNSTSCSQVSGTTTTALAVRIFADEAGAWNAEQCSLRAGLADCNNLHDAESGIGIFNITASAQPLPLLGLYISNISAPATAVNNSQINVIVFGRNPNPANSSYALAGCSFTNPSGSLSRHASSCLQLTANSTQQFMVSNLADIQGPWTVANCFINASGDNCATSLLHNVSPETRTVNVILPPDLYITSVTAQEEAVNNTNVPIDVYVSNPLNDDRYGQVSCIIENPVGANQTKQTACSLITRQNSRRYNTSVFANTVGTWNVRNCTVSASSSSSCSGAQATSSMINGDAFRVIRGYNLTISNIAISSPAYTFTPVFVSYTLRNPSATERFGRVTCTFTKGVQIVNRSACFTLPAESFVDSRGNLTTEQAGTWTVNCNAERSADSSCSSVEVHDSESLTFNISNPPDIYIQSVDMSALAPLSNLSVATLRIRNTALTPLYGFAGCTFKNRLNETFRNVSQCDEMSSDTNNVAIGIVPELRGNWSVSGCFVNASRSQGCGGNRTHNISTVSKSFSVTAPLLRIEQVYLTSANLLVGEIADISVDVKNIGEREYTGFVNCTMFNPYNTTIRLTTPNQSIPLGEIRTFNPQYIVDVPGRWRVSSCSIYRLGSIILEDSENVNKPFNVTYQPPDEECNNNVPCETGYVCDNGFCVPEPVSCSASNCPGVKDACYCSSNQCIACGSGYACSSGSCVPEIPVGACNSNSQCPAEQICVNSVCQQRPPECYQNSDCPASQECENGRCTASEPVSRDIIVLLIIILAVIMVPLILFIYIKRSL